MMYVTYAPFRALEREIESVFDRFPEVWRDDILPSDLYEDEKNLYADVELPGVSKDQIKITIHKGIVTIKAERRNRSDNERRYLHSERARGAMSRSFKLPADVDVSEATAKFANGILHLTMPKSNPRDVEQTIEVR